MKMNFARLTVFGLVLALGACSDFQHLNDKVFREDAQIAEKTPTQVLLEKLPVADQPVVLSVYEFQDQTGAQKANDNFAEFSHAVTQGGVNILYKALLDAGKGGWFTVIERAGSKNLMAERQLIRNMRQQYAQGKKLPDIEPLLYAGVLLEGGIVAYDSNVLTGGAGAAYLGVTGNSTYRRDMVTVYLRAVSVQNGEVLASVNTSKTIYSTNIQANIFKYVSFDEILQAETGYSVNEPPQMAVRQAIEYAVYSLVMEGSMKGLWGFAQPNSARDSLKKYLKGRDGEEPTDAELNRMLGVSGASAVPVLSQASESPMAPPAPAPQAMAPQAVVTRPQTQQPQTGSAGANVYAAPAAPDQTPPVPAQMSSDAKYIDPAPGERAPEDKLHPVEKNEPAPQFFVNQDGGQKYTVKCVATGCFPSTDQSSLPAGTTGGLVPPSAGR